MVYAQGQVALYQMQKSIPQANYVNPAFSPKSKIIIGLPLISSTYIAVEGPIGLNDILSPGNGDSLKLDTDAILDALNTNNQVDIQGSASLLFLGLNLKNSFMTLSFNSRIDGGFSFPGSALELIITGPNSDQTGSKTIKLNDFDLKASAFNELAFSYNRELNDKLVVGGKVKYLQGLVNLNLDGLNGQITTNIDSINISSNPWSFQTSGLDTIGNASSGYFLFQNKNVGFAFDFGAQYKINDNIKVSASVLDLGSITWKEDVKTYEFDAVDYTFDGFDFLEIVKDDGTVDDSILDQELDSLETALDPTELEGGQYKTPLTGKFYLGGTYSLMEMHTFGAIFYGKVFKSRLVPAMALTYNIALGEILDLGVSASYRNKTFGNFGVGLSVKGGPIQLYALGENFESLFYPSRARTVGIRGGLVLSLGKTPAKSFD